MANENDDAKSVLMIAVAVAGVVAVYLVVQLLQFLAVLSLAAMVILAIALATFGGFFFAYKLAFQEAIWDNRRIAKHKRHQFLREREKQHFLTEGQEWMHDVVDAHYDDQARDLYAKKDHLGDFARAAGKVKEIFKR